MKNYNIYVRSAEHARTINTPANGRTNYTCHTVKGWDALEAKVAELVKAGSYITEVRTDLGTLVGPNDKAKFER